MPSLELKIPPLALTFRRAQVTLDPRDPGKTARIVEHGIYRFSRNPMYLGMALALAGVAAWRSHALAWALVAGFIAWIQRFQIAPEERMLHARFGDAYAGYVARVRRWI